MIVIEPPNRNPKANTIVSLVIDDMKADAKLYGSITTTIRENRKGYKIIHSVNTPKENAYTISIDLEKISHTIAELQRMQHSFAISVLNEYFSN